DRDAEATAPLEVHYKDGAKESRELAIAPHDYDIQKLSLPETMVTPPKDVLARIDSDKMAIRKARAKISEPCNFFGTFSRPAEGIISGTYGSQRILNGKPKNPHMGMDIAGKVGTPVKAPLAGTVSLIRDMYYTGNTVLIDHGCGVQTVYAHLSKVLVNTGRHVEQGELIGQIGKTGRATGPHLHWGLSLEGQQLNPQPYLK
ncbi:MAG: M23 family metallopeptidase, partial [Proteobacteria bacterium]|nr:M23 family metallopeptidase [Pseudomonadota bacterium]